MPFSTARDWVQLCKRKDAARAADGPHALCHAYLRGYLGSAAFLGAFPLPRPHCVPEALEPEQARRVFLDWSRRFPDALDAPMAFALATALGEAFPCR